ncbi:peptidylprolyl isomerase [Arthrobacter sp. AQ5-05]|uniref:SurA N-terminal domain-containing protein n=1 Tax=Arthrobacter sp. AQ5-05 TaxID=2184581 RepID=UPI000DCB198F|nr:SurA N-terminal domain-containing protein [Arthrobacter sp. AQ5-05]RAX48736.1 peptidylprolyl isomerase [Arthrobacter sp. AQ5-05]
MLQKKWVLSMALVASLSFMTGCSATAEPEAAPASSSAAVEAAPSDAASPTPDLAGVPEIIATVNGEEITKADFTRIYEGQFAQVLQQAQLSGEELDQGQLRKQTAEGLVNTELLIQQAAKKKVFATSKDLDAALGDVAKSNDMDTKEFLAAMDAQGLNQDAVRAQLKTQLEVERLIAKEVGDFRPSEKETKAAYQVVLDQFKKQATTDKDAPKAPSYKTMKSELEQQLKLQKEAAAVKDYVAVLRKDAKITMGM